MFLKRNEKSWPTMTLMRKDTNRKNAVLTNRLLGSPDRRIKKGRPMYIRSDTMKTK